MAETSLTLTLPYALAREFESVNQDFLLELLERGLREMKIDRALNLYRKGGISIGATAERAGISQSELARHAYARGLEPPVSPEMLAEELS